MRAQPAEPLTVVVRTPRISLEQRHHAQRVRLRGAVGEGDNRSLDHVNPGLDGRKIGGRRQPRCVVAVQDDRHTDPLFQLGNQIMGHFRRDESRHVFDADRLASAIDERLAQFHKGLDGMNRTDRVADFATRLLAGRQGRVDRRMQVAHIVEGVENAQHIHPAIRRALHECRDHIVRKTRVLHDVLPPQKHTVRRLGGALLQRADPCKRILAQKTQTRINRRPAPRFQLVKTQRVQISQGREHLLGPHPRRREGLVSVAQHRIGKLNAPH